MLVGSLDCSGLDDVVLSEPQFRKGVPCVVLDDLGLDVSADTNPVNK